MRTGLAVFLSVLLATTAIVAGGRQSGAALLALAAAALATAALTRVALAGLFAAARPELERLRHMQERTDELIKHADALVTHAELMLTSLDGLLRPALGASASPAGNGPERPRPRRF